VSTLQEDAFRGFRRRKILRVAFGMSDFASTRVVTPRWRRVSWLRRGIKMISHRRGAKVISVRKGVTQMARVTMVRRGVTQMAVRVTLVRRRVGVMYGEMLMKRYQPWGARTATRPILVYFEVSRLAFSFFIIVIKCIAAVVGCV